MEDPLELTTPYFPEYSDAPNTDERSALVSLLSGDFSTLLGGVYATLQEDEEWPDCKMCERPLVPYLQINVSAASTPADFCAYLDFSPPHAAEGATLFQIFICTGPGHNGSCLGDWTSGSHPGEAMRVRCAHFRNPTDIRSRPTQPGALAGAPGVLPQRVISEWTPGAPEVAHFELLYMLGLEFDEDFYDAHEPAGGLKLLGNAVLGKAQNFPDRSESEGGTAHCEAEGYTCYRSLVQLGTDDGDVTDYAFVIPGSVFVYQCKAHPDDFQPGYSFSW